jgi:hypothetical protein
MDWMKPDKFEISAWERPVAITAPYRPDFADDEALKQAYGVELGKGLDAFNAAMELLKELPKALWASLHWVNDPIVCAAKDTYVKTLKKLEKPLTKEELLAKVLSFTDEKINGVHLVEAKVRLQAFQLYSEISGYTGRVNIDASTNINSNNTTNNLMKITLVKGEDRPEPKVIEASNTKSKIQNDELPSIALKLVGGTSR